MFKSITFHRHIIPSASTVEVLLGALNAEVIGAIKSYYPEYELTDTVKVLGRVYYLFVYIKGDRFDCEYNV